MPILSSSLRRSLALGAALALAAIVPVRAGLLLSFDNLMTGPLADSGNIFITFSSSQSGFDVSYSNISTSSQTPLLQLGGTVGNVTTSNPGGWTDSISLSQASNFTINNLNSGAIYVSYGQGLNMANSYVTINSTLNQISSPSPTNISDQNFYTRYTPFEITYGTGFNSNGDVTAINFFSSALAITNYDTPGNHAVSNGTISYNPGVTNNQVFSLLAPVAAGNALSYVTNITPYSGGATVPIRVLAPDSFSTFTNATTGTAIAGGGYANGPFHLWTDAVDRMATANFTTTLSGNQSKIVGGDNWTWDYNFTATGNSTTGVYLNGTITSSYYATSGGNVGVVITGNTVSGLSAFLPPDGINEWGLTNNELSFMIWTSNPTILQTYNNGTVTMNTTVGTQVNAAWGTIDSLTAAGGNATMFPRILGDFSEGLLTGFLGSPAFGNLTSTEWWANGANAYSGGNGTYFNEYGNIVWQLSNGTIYGNQYDDRFGAVGVPATGEWVVTLFPDGAVPEAADAALAVAAGGFLGALLFRRRARK